MSRTVIGVFSSRDKAESAVNKLKERGFDESRISIVGREKEIRGGDKSAGRGSLMGDMGGDQLSGGITTGGTLGGLAGLLAGVGALAIPGIGPIVAAGPLAAVITGAVGGGIAGGLIDWGIPEERGRFYEGRVREGKILAAIKTDDSKQSEVASILRENGATDVESHSSR